MVYASQILILYILNLYSAVCWLYHNKTGRRKLNCRSISLMNIDTNVFNKMLANWIHQHVKRIMLHGQLGFTSQMRGCFNIWKCNRIKDSRWRIAFDKNPIPIHDKNSEQTGNKRELPQPDKEHLWKTNIILNSEKLQAFALRSGTRQACLLLPLLSICTGDSRQGNKDRKRNERHQIGKEEVFPICRLYLQMMWYFK